MTTIRIGTRGSALARWQAHWVASRLEGLGQSTELVPITTQGDAVTDRPIGTVGATGVFTREIQRALLDGRCDLAVHSLKDLPTAQVAGLVLAAVPKRETIADALIARDAHGVFALPAGATVGTGSLRRRAQLLHARPDLVMADIRGNVDTRLAKLDAGEFDAIVLAEAGLKRLGLADRVTEVLPVTLMLPAVGQGALGLETREDDDATRSAVAALNDAASRAGVLAERASLAQLEGGCLAPIAAWGRVEESRELCLSVRVLSADGQTMIACRRRQTLDASSPHEADTEIDDEMAENLGRAVAEELLSHGAARLVETARTA